MKSMDEILLAAGIAEGRCGLSMASCFGFIVVSRKTGRTRDGMAGLVFGVSRYTNALRI
jgi:hypothetical protein